LLSYRGASQHGGQDKEYVTEGHGGNYVFRQAGMDMGY
jgi:hypothetical protein